VQVSRRTASGWHKRKEERGGEYWASPRGTNDNCKPVLPSLAFSAFALPSGLLLLADANARWLNCQDFVVDAMAEPQSLESVGRDWGFDGRGMHAHEGILRRAEWIRRYIVA